MTQGKLFTHTHVPLSPSSTTGTGQTTVMLYGWEGYHIWYRSGVALAMHHGLSGISTYGLNGLKTGEEWSTAPLPLALPTQLPVFDL